jgi:hypothetical protein
MERGSNQHSPRVDEQLEHEVESLVHGGPVESRAEESRLQEDSGDDEPFAESIVARGADDAAEAGLTHGDVRARSELARHLRGSLFPADRTALVQFAVEEHLPPDIAAALRGLPPGRYMNVEGVWEALGGRREERITHGDDHGAVDPVAASEPRLDEPAVTEPRPPGTAETAPTERFGFRFDLLHRLAAVPFLVSPGSAEVLVDRSGDEPVLSVRFGPWRVRTPVDNVAATSVTGPYRSLKTIGPAHVSFADGGLTFGTNDSLGLCIEFREPVGGIDPLGVVRHRSMTVTVADVDALRAAIGAS